ncbi:hypothetical protein [Turicimonas muris]|uniref:hypothetical protein n=11 Tax=Turicimonas muris TaxID=1796652 RepID=UPI0026F38A1E|nr:hypothetical protein [Turicimonas muris]
MLSPSTSQHIHAADFVLPRPFAEFVQQNKDRLNALKRNWPYGSKFFEVLHVVREVQAHHQRLPLHEASDYDHEEGAMHSALDLANEALVLLKGIPVHMDLPLVKREEQKERVFFSIVLCALFSNIADGDVRYRIDGFDADDNRTTKTPCLPLARFFEKDHVRVRLWKKTEPDFHLYQSYASRILHEAGKKVLDKIPDHEFSSLYGFVCAFVENRMKDAQSLDPILFDCLLRAKKKISDRNHLLNSGYLDDRTAPTLKRELSLILSELFKNEWSIDTGGALRNSMVLFHAGKVYLRYPEAFSHIEERLDSRWADSPIPINPKKILSYMTKSRMVEQESNSLMIKLKFVEEPELPVQKTKTVTVQADAVSLSNPSQYLAEGTKTREYHDQDRVKNNLSRLVKEKIQYGEKDLSGLEQETCVAEYDISSNRSSDKQTERSKGFSKLFDAILPVLKKDADSKSKINKDSEPKSPAELAVIKAKRSRKDSLVNQKTEEIKTQLSDENVYPYADRKAAAIKPAPGLQTLTKSEDTEVVQPSPKEPSQVAAMSSTEQDSTTSESSNVAADRATEVNSSEPAGISLGSRLKGFGRSFTSKFQGVVASIKKVKIFEFSKEPSLSVPTSDNVSAEDGIYYVAPTKAASKDKVSSTEEIMASSAGPTVHEAPENSSETTVSPGSTKEAGPLKQATVSIDSSSIANLSEKAELSQPLTETEKNFSSEEDSVHSTQEQTGSLGSQKSLEPKSPETSTAGQENSASADSLEPSKGSLTSLVATEVSSAESSVEDHSKSSNTPASTVEEATEQTVRKQSDQPSQNKAKTEEIRPKAEVLPSELSKSSASSKDVSPKGAISSEFKEEQKENVKAAKASKDVKPVSGSCSLEGSAKTANNNGVEDSSGSSPNNKQSKEQTVQLKTSSTKEKNSNKSSSEAKKSSKQKNTKQVPTTSATPKNASPNKSAKTNKAENAAKAQGQVKSVSTESVSNKKADSAIASGQASHKLNSNTKNQTVNAHEASAQKKSETQMTGADSKPSQHVANKKNSEKAASTGTEKLSTHNKNQKQSALPATSSTAKSKPISSEGTNSEGQTRTDIRNEAVKQHNKEKAAAARKENKRVNDILAVAGKPKAELQGLTPITGAKKSKIESVAASSASNEASKQKKTERQLSSSAKKNQPKASSSKTSVSSEKGKVSTSTVNKKKAGEEKITSGDKDLSSQKLSTQKKTIKTSSPEKSSPQKTPTQKPTTEEKATENSPTGSHSPQKSSSAKKTNASQKVANQVSPSSLSPAENLSSQQESSPEQKPSSKEHLLSRETVSAESASPSPASCTSSPTIPAGDRAPTQKKASPTQEGASTENISPGEEVSPEKQSSPAKRILTSTSLSSEDEPALVEPVPTAFINSNKEEKKTSAEEKTLKETTLGEKDPEKPLAEKSAAKKIAEEKTPSQENSSPEVLPTSLEGNSTVGEVLLLLSPLFKEEHTAGVGLPISSEEAKLLSPSYLLSPSLEESSRAGEQEEVCNTQTQKEEKPSSRTDIVSDKNAVKKKFICPQDTELQLPSKPLLLCAPASVSIAKQKSVLDSQKAEVESDSDKISLEEGLAQLFSMDVKDFFSEDSEAKANLSRPAKRQSSAPAVAKAIKEFISDPNNPLVAKGAQFIYSVSDDEISDDAELRSNRSAKAVSSKVQPGSTSGSNKLPEGACKVKHPSAKTSVAPTLGDQCVITRTHMFGSSSAGREYQSGILTIRADVVKLTNPENKEPDKQHTGKKTRAQKINEAQLATIRGQAKKEVRGKAQKPGLKHGKKSEPPAPLPSKISHLGVSLFVSRFGLK